MYAIHKKKLYNSGEKLTSYTKLKIKGQERKTEDSEMTRGCRGERGTGKAPMIFTAAKILHVGLL